MAPAPHVPDPITALIGIVVVGLLLIYLLRRR
jgi:LPXTG-motif cell wall-anchored protein